MPKEKKGSSLIRVPKLKTRRNYSSKEKIRIIIDGMRGKITIAELCRKEAIAQNSYYKWRKDFIEAGKKRLSGDAIQEVNTSEVRELKNENRSLKELVLELSLKNQDLKKYNTDIDLSVNGGLKTQVELLSYHLNELFAKIQEFISIDLSKEFNTETLVAHYFPELAARMSQISSKNSNDDSAIEKKQESVLTKHTTAKKKIKKKERPNINEEDVEKLLIESLF